MIVADQLQRARIIEQTRLGEMAAETDLLDVKREYVREWERIANELKLKLGIRVSPRTVGKYVHSGGPRRVPDPKQRWLTFVRNHARAIMACDFFVVITATFRTLYVSGVGLIPH